MDTFDDLEKPFPLFNAPIAHAVLDGPGLCIHCKSQAWARFNDACYVCFRSGNIDAVIDTEFGMVTRDDAALGRTHGIPLHDPSSVSGYKLTQHPVDPRFPDDHWYHVHIDSEHLNELLRTPKYHTWQGETWLFCCQRPMEFRGSLPADMFSGDLDSLLSEIGDFLSSPDWQRTTGEGHGSLTYYVFTCPACKVMRYNEDCD